VIEEEKKKGEKPIVYISQRSPDDPDGPIVTKSGKVGGMNYVINCANSGVDRSRVVSSAVS
jgi:hypothetical protein